MSEQTSVNAKRILLVGHCRPDAFFLRSVVERAIPGAVIESVNDDAAVGSSKADLLLVNRALDGRFRAATGVELIRSLAERGAAAGGAGAPVMMLVSNFEDAQEQAEAAGAAPGFGKSDAYSAETAVKLRRAVGLD